MCIAVGKIVVDMRLGGVGSITPPPLAHTALVGLVEWKWRGTHVKRIGVIENSRFAGVEEDLNGDTAVPDSVADGRWGSVEAHGMLTVESFEA